MSALLYRSNQRWQIWAAFGGAVIIHLSAVALAKSHLSPMPPVAPETDIVLEVVDAGETPPDPPPLEDPPPPPPVADDDFIPDDNPTPPPMQKQFASIMQRLVKPASRSTASATLSAAEVLAITAPRPEYPYEARRQHITGSGVAVLTVDPRTGQVVEVTIVRSTGSAVLDNATISGFRRWRFRPGTVSRVQSPITYTLTGATY